LILLAFEHQENRMTKTAGHIIRMSGLVVEMLGVLAFFSSAGAKDQARIPLPGGTSAPLAGVAVVVGFVLWLAGTIVVYTARAQSKARTLDE
jgi:hypothetical protein